MGKYEEHAAVYLQVLDRVEKLVRTYRTEPDINKRYELQKQLRQLDREGTLARNGMDETIDLPDVEEKG